MNKFVKSLMVFSLLLIPNLVFADNSTVLSDTVLMKMYSGPADMQNAINNGSLQYSQIPPDLQVAVKNTPPSNNNSILPSWIGQIVILLVMVLIVLIILGLVIKGLKGSSSEDDSDEQDIDSIEDRLNDNSEDKFKTKSEDKPKSKTFDPHPMGGKTHD